MPELRKQLSKQLSTLPRPKVLCTKAFLLGFPEVLGINEIFGKGSFNFETTVSVDVLPFLADFKVPATLGGTIPILTVPGINDFTGNAVPLRTVVSSDGLGPMAACQMSVELLPSFEQGARLDSAYGTHEVSLILSCITDEVGSLSSLFPDLHSSLVLSEISEDLFIPLEKPRVLGMNYSDRIWRDLTPKQEEINTPTRGRKRLGQTLRKSYELDTTQVENGNKVKNGPSSWDLFYVLLQPPLTLDGTSDFSLPHELYKYQYPGIDFLMNTEGALLADEMGTGKTVMTTVAMRLLFQKGKIRTALVLCPPSVLLEWERHLQEWAPELSVELVRGSQESRQLDWSMPFHVYVTTYDTLRSDAKRPVDTSIDGLNFGRSALGKFDFKKFDLIVLDEAQNIKNPQSGRARTVKKFHPTYRWALSGTPIENKLEDVISIFEFLHPGYMTLSDLNLGQVRNKIAPYFLRRRKEDVLPELPKKKKQEFWTELDKAQRAEYERCEQQIRGEITISGERLDRISIFRAINKLKQICNFASDEDTSPKLKRLKDQLEEIIANGEKVIVFSQYIGEGIDKLEKALARYKIAKIVGGQSDTERATQVKRFKNTPASEVPILLASVKAGGVGLNLKEATYVIHFDHWWNPAVMWQAEDRAHRADQTHGVNVYSYWVSDTIDERIHALLEKKGLLFEEVIGSLSSDDIDACVSDKDLYEILGVEPPAKPAKAVVEKSEMLEVMSITEIREQLYAMSPTAFERLTKELFRHLGYPNVKTTKRSHDGGVDVIASRNTSDGPEKVFAQCKRYKGNVGVEIARELRGVIATDKEVEKGYLVTSGEFSTECQRFAESEGVITLISGIEVAKYVKTFGLSFDV